MGASVKNYLSVWQDSRRHQETSSLTFYSNSISHYWHQLCVESKWLQYNQVLLFWSSKRDKAPITLSRLGEVKWHW